MTNNIKFSIRSLMRQKGYALVNVLGLALGMALFQLISVYVYKELQTDKHHDNYNEIYRIEIPGGAVTASMVATFAQTILPEALEICRIDVHNSSALVNVEEKQFRVHDVIYADSSFFKIFSFDIIHGDPKIALSNPMSIVLSQSEATKLFGDKHPVGKVIRLNNAHNLEVTAVMADSPANSSFKSRAVIPFHAFPIIRNDSTVLNDWNNWNYHTFVLLPREHDITALNLKVAEGFDRMVQETFGFEDVEIGFFLRPLSDIYFNHNIQYDSLEKGNMTFILIYIAIAIFILTIAVVNFVNLSTAMAFRRAREVGLKKVMGSTRGMLVRQYLIEAVVISMAAFLLAIIFVEILIPEFNRLTLVGLQFSLIKNSLVILLFASIAILIGLLSGIYPAFYLTRFEPVVVMKGEVTRGMGGSLLRKILIVFQFTISIGIILSTIIIFSQMKYARNKDIGFDRNNIVYFWSAGNVIPQYESFKAELKQIPGVEFVGLSGSVPGYVGMSWGRQVDGTERRMNAMTVDPEFIYLYGLEIIEGRSFDPDLATDRDRTFILNETAVRMFELEDPVGKQLADGTIIGVVRDFSYLSVHHNIGPLVLAYYPGWSRQISIRLSGGNMHEAIQHIETVWNSFAPGFPFRYQFLDDAIGRLYAKEQRLFRLFMYFSILAIFVACLGLSGLALFATQQRTKEVGIRKVFGSSVKNIVLLLTGDFLRWVLLANIIAWPLTWIAMNRWLGNFAYHISIQWWMFALSVLLAVVIALLTILFQAIRAALANPVKALKYE
jgi:putative ABC transport system permease protein